MLNVHVSKKRLQVLGKKISLRVIKHIEATSSIEVPKAQMAGGCEYSKVCDMASIPTPVYIHSPPETGPRLDRATMITFMFLEPTYDYKQRLVELLPSPL